MWYIEKNKQANELIKSELASPHGFKKEKVGEGWADRTKKESSLYAGYFISSFGQSSSVQYHSISR